MPEPERSARTIFGLGWHGDCIPQTARCGRPRVRVAYTTIRGREQYVETAKFRLAFLAMAAYNLSHGGAWCVAGSRGSARKGSSMSDTNTVVAPATTEPVLVAFTAKGAVNPFKPGSQRAIWFASLQAYEGKPVSEWLAAVAAEIPAQRVKEGHRSPHKGGAGFLRRFALEGLLAWRDA